MVQPAPLETAVTQVWRANLVLQGVTATKDRAVNLEHQVHQGPRDPKVRQDHKVHRAIKEHVENLDLSDSQGHLEHQVCLHLRTATQSPYSFL